MIITIPGEPVPKGRPKFTSQGHAYTPKRTKDYESLVKQHIMLQGGYPVDYPVEVTIRIYKSIPKSWSKAKKALAIKGEIRPTVRPDIDNYVKALLDASNGLLFKDDSLVVELTASKLYVGHTEEMPYAEIEVNRWKK